MGQIGDRYSAEIWAQESLGWCPFRFKWDLKLAAGLGFEPRHTAPKTVVLPLDYPANCRSSLYFGGDAELFTPTSRSRTPDSGAQMGPTLPQAAVLHDCDGCGIGRRSHP